jgi:hypothetical protein
MSKLPKYEPKGRFLEDYPELVPYLKGTDEGDDSKDYRIRFASTKKSSLFTHWSNRSFPVDEKDLFVPNGLHFGYYDDELGGKPQFLGAQRLYSLVPESVAMYKSLRNILPPNGPNPPEHSAPQGI